MSRALAIVVHVVLGLFWVSLVGVVAAFVASTVFTVVWVGSMLALWVLAVPRTETEMDQEFFKRLEALEGRLLSLQSELAELRAAAGVEPAGGRPSPTVAMPAPAPPVPAAAPAATSYAWFEPDDEPAVEQEPASPPYVAPPSGPSLADRLAAIDTSTLLGARGLAVAGGIVTLLGVVFFFVLAVNNGWIGPVARVSLGAAAAAIVFGAGVYVRARYGQLWSALAAAGAGIAGGYATLLAATALYDLVPKPAGLVLAAVIAAAGLAVALAWDSQVIGVLGLIGAMAAPALLAFDGGLTNVGVGFVALVFAALAFVAVRQAWQMLLWIGAVVALGQIAALVFATDSPGLAVAVLAIVFTALHLAAGIQWQLERGDSRTDALSSTFVLGSAALVGLSGARIFDSTVGRMSAEGLWLAAAALVYGGLAVFFFRRGRQRDLATLLSAAALTLAAIPGADFVSGATLAVVWAAEAAALAWVAFRTREPRFQLAALVYVGLATGHALVFDLPPDRLFTASRHPAHGILSVAAALAGAVAVAVAVAWWARQGAFGTPDGERVGFLGQLDRLWAGLAAVQEWIRRGAVALAAILGAGAVSAALLEGAEDLSRAGGTGAAFDRGHVLVTAAWAALGLAGVLVGLSRRAGWLTDGSLAWLLLVAIKTLAYDFEQIGGDRWPIAFAASAAGILLAGYAFELLDRRILKLSAVGPVAAVMALGLGCAAIFGFSDSRGLSDDATGLLALGLAAIYAALGSTVLRRRRGLATVLCGLALLLALPASGLVIQDQWLVAAWAAAAAALAWLGHRLREERFELAAVAYAGLAFLGTLIAGAQPNDLVLSGSNPGAGHRAWPP